jgi:medium-chain acyl-[acyl-carrier-protein] hydrolase
MEVLATAKTGPSIVRPIPRPAARLRLFCFPYAGGSASAYRTWAGLLPDSVELCAVQLPGRENRAGEPLLTRMDDVVAMLMRDVPAFLTMPYAFFGHSMGSHIAFELARALRRKFVPGPVHLFASGRHAPQLPDAHKAIHALPDDEFIEELRLLQGTPDEVLRHPELMQLLTPILRADFAVCETYEYRDEAPLSCPITALGGADDAEASETELAAWETQTARRFDMLMFPGNHFFLHEARREVAAAIMERLGPLVAGMSGGVYA